MKYFLDTEFNGFGGELISLALVREDNESIYLVYDAPKVIEPWVMENVMPILTHIPSPLPGMAHFDVSQPEGALLLGEFFRRDPTTPYIITDWPDDIRYLCQAVITGPGMMANIPRMIFDMVRVDAYPTKVEGAIQHNAWWDAKALQDCFVI